MNDDEEQAWDALTKAEDIRKPSPKLKRRKSPDIQTPAKPPFTKKLDVFAFLY